MKLLLNASLVLLTFTCSWAQEDPADGPEANPGRPTVSTPAAITPVGYLQFETGALSAGHSPEAARRYSVNEVIKLAVHPRLEFLLQGEPPVWSRDTGKTELHEGEAFLGGQAVLSKGEIRPTVSISYFHRIHKGSAPEVDIGTFHQGGIFLISGNVKGFHFDANAFLNEMHEEGVRRGQTGQSLSISHPVKNLVVSGEIWHFTQPFLHSRAMGNLWAVSYAARRNLVFDAGFDRGLTTTSTRWELFAGFTYLLPHRLW